ncbi:hypothetical protein L4D08_00365 [Photobacterium chitinilyticum]|uniref:hypothetical protein n=1 Tax=Photobacterium chitinilyticum TaxID=2485123 RepID=UPI003D0A1F79
MKFKKEFSLSDVIASLALIVSAVAFWQSYKANDGFIVQGGGPALVSGIKNECSVMVTIPLEFHNSGKRALTLRRFTPAEIDNVLFVNGNKIDIERRISYEFYISSEEYSNTNELLQKVRKIGEYDLSKYASSNYLIEPGKVFKTNVIVVSRPFSNKVQLADRIFVAFNTEFSNGQTVELRSGIDISVPESMRIKCSS